MPKDWKKELDCAANCRRCGQPLETRARRILSVYDHVPICMNCKKAEEKLPDYPDVAKQMVASCIDLTGKPYGDPAGYCFHHFCPYKCD